MIITTFPGPRSARFCAAVLIAGTMAFVGCMEINQAAPAAAEKSGTAPATISPELADAAGKVGRLYNVDPPVPASADGLKALRVGIWYGDPAVADPCSPGHWKLRMLQPDAAFMIGDRYIVRDSAEGKWLHGAYDNDRQAVVGRQLYATLDELIAAHDYPSLPRAPAGFTLREVARLPDFPTRLASNGKGGPLFILCQSGNVYRVDPKSANGKPHRVLEAGSYLKAGYWFTLGLTLDAKGRLYLVANERDESVTPVTNRVTIFRTMPDAATVDKLAPKPWLQVSFPYEIKTFNHGVSHIATGPDGFLYVNSGSRTDAGEEGEDPRFARIGEIDLTACLWRLDPNQEKPQVEVFARGLRNTYGFCWDAKGRMLATDNGPNRDAPEELNLIEKGKHYGFPYEFSDLATRPYDHEPKSASPIVAGASVRPIRNMGPDGGQADGQKIATFTPHSSPSGMVYLGDGFPNDYRGTFLIGRFGNLFRYPEVSGFDVLRVRLRENGNGIEGAEVHKVLSPLGRPIDLHLWGPGSVVIGEYSRDTCFPSPASDLPGRILELRVAERAGVVP